MGKLFSVLILAAVALGIVSCEESLEGGDQTILGTEKSPYQISTADELRQLAADVNSGITYVGEYFIMTQDIDLGGSSDEFIAIGTQTNTFQGQFDGAGHEVSNLYIYQPESYYQGLFGYVYGATIKNLVVSGQVTGYSSTGGIVGYADHSTISYCYNMATILGMHANIGGIVGGATSSIEEYEGGTISYCYNMGEVSGELQNVGGIAGFSSATVYNCCNSANIDVATAENNEEHLMNGSIGGLIGCNYYGTLYQSYNTGNVSSGDSSQCTGGLIGLSYGTTYECYNTGEVSSGDLAQYIGGIIGISYGTTYACYNRGNVSSDSDSAQGAGGIIAFVAGTLSTTYNCYSTAALSGDIYIGGAIGIINSSASASYCYHNSANYSGDAVAGSSGVETDVTSKPDDEMKSSTFVTLLNTGLSDSLWVYDSSNINNGYPILSWQL